jgi:hypothetical protein
MIGNIFNDVKNNRRSEYGDLNISIGDEGSYMIGDYFLYLW